MSIRSGIIRIVLLLIVAGAVLAGVFYWRELRGVWPAISGPSGNIADIIDNNNNNPGDNSTEFPLKLPDNFKIEIFARNVPNVRVMTFDPLGNLWVSQTSEGKVSQLEIKNGQVTRVNEIFRNLDHPHGLAFDPENSTTLYIAEEGRVSFVPVYSEAGMTKLVDLPTGGGHSTRTIDFGPDGRLYVSIGSSCNVCNESDPRRAAIYSMNKNGSDFKSFATGLRNSVFFAWSEVDGRMWATDMGRDMLGDNTPPEEINIIAEGKNYGWPNCYGKNIHDTDFDKKIYIRNPCSEPFETGAHVEMQAHSAPLGLAFVKESAYWPEDYWYDLIVAYHGSWNRSEPTGYKLVRIKLDAQGNYQGTEDFVSGWLQGSRALGRPVDVKMHNGEIYVSDDKAGVIYKITYQSPQ